MADSLEKARMQYAWQWVNGAAKAAREAQTRAIKGLGVLLRSQGVLVALAVLCKDGKTRPLAEMLARWLLYESPLAMDGNKTLGGGPIETLAEQLAQAPRAQYQAAQAEALALAEILKIYIEIWNLKDGQ